jgi:hypothetical protein
VFGWPGNIRHALTLYGHPVNVQAPGTVRYHDPAILPDVHIDRERCRVDVSLADDRSLFRIYDTGVLSGRVLPESGIPFKEENATVTVTRVTPSGTPTGVSISIPSAVCQTIPIYLATPNGLTPALE